MEIVNMQGRISVAKRGFIALIMALAAMTVFASGAGAVLVHVGHGRVAGILPHRGIKATSIPGSFASSNVNGASGASGTAPGGPSAGTLVYNGGQVLHAASPYLIFWDPNNQITSAQKNLLERYFTDAAADSEKSTNVYGVLRQYTDTSGFADYQQTFSSAQAITDTQPYPTSGQQCTEQSGGYTETACLYDAQIQTELTRLISAQSLPTGTSGSAPIYFVVTPSMVNTCQSDNSTCADNYYCAYHSSFTLADNSTVLYADMPMLLAGQDPKACQYDGNSATQEPNGDYTDVVTGDISHEFSETITDPVNGGGWWDTSTGNEVGDNCAFYGITVDPASSSNPDAFAPTLGGSAGAGTLYDQTINSHDYYTQTEWSNGDSTCEAQPTSSALSAAFSGPTSVAAGSAATFNPAASSNAAAYSSTTWSWGDGTSTFSPSAPASTAHTFTPVHAAFSFSPTRPLTTTNVQFDGSGSFFSSTDDVTLTLVDQYGNLSSVAHPTSLTGAGSSTLTYSWDFHDGGTANTVTPSHRFTAPGQHTVTLTVGNGSFTDTTTQTVSVDMAPLTAAFNVTTSNPTAGSPVSFDGSGSSEAGGSISSYSWSFGDGATDTTTGAHPSHTYGLPGTYNVTLTVADPDGHTASVTHSVTVAAVPATPAPAPAKGIPTAVIAVNTAHPVAKVPVLFNGAGSKDTGSTITSYSWAFGDGSTSGAASPTHTYAKPGKYTVRLTVVDATGSSATSTETVSVGTAVITGVKVRTGKRVEQIRLTLSGPGVLSTGVHHFRIRQPETFVYRLKLTPTQKAVLSSHRIVHVKLVFKFVPSSGRTLRKTVAFAVKP